MSAIPSAPPLSDEFEQLNIDSNTGTAASPQLGDAPSLFYPPPPYTSTAEGGVHPYDPSQGFYYQSPPPQYTPGDYALQYLPVGYPQYSLGDFPPQPPAGPQPSPEGYFLQHPPGGFPPQIPPPGDYFAQGFGTPYQLPQSSGASSPQSQPSAPPLENGLVSIGCHVCQKINNVKVGPSSTILICSQCKEITPLAPPPAGRQYVRCQCNTLLMCTLSAYEAVCPNDTCKTLVRLQVPPGVIATPRETAELAVVSVQCQVCEKILRIRRETTITVALCSTCGERSPIAPPSLGTKYVRCICLNLVTANSTATTVACSRQICARSLKIGPLVTFPAGSGTYPVHTSSMLLGFANGFSTVTCDVCCETLNVPKNMTKKLLSCNHCKEATPLEPPDPGKRYFRCYCNCLLTCSVTSSKVLCPRQTCKLTVNIHVQDPALGSKNNVILICPVCNAVTVKVVVSDSRVVTCTCGTQVPIGRPPRGKRYVYCTCNALLLCAATSVRVRCSRANCRREFSV
ncbi:hypothetical protein EMCRGX_G028815 [Ephydatia muelleri]